MDNHDTSDWGSPYPADVVGRMFSMEWLVVTSIAQAYG